MADAITVDKLSNLDTISQLGENDRLLVTSDGASKAITGAVLNSSIGGGSFIDVSKLSDGYSTGTKNLTDYTLPYNSLVIIGIPPREEVSGERARSYVTLQIKINTSAFVITKVYEFEATSTTGYASNGPSSILLKKNTTIDIVIVGRGWYTICPVS